MTTRIPVTLEGNLTADPEFGTSNSGTDYARFQVAVNDRRLNNDTGQWEDAGRLFHRVTAFNNQARNVADSLKKGDAALVIGELRFGEYEKDGQVRESREVIADAVGPSLRFNTAAVDRRPKVSGPEAHATGPIAVPAATDAEITR